MEQEIWKDIVWYEWLYRVSNLWNVKSLYRRKKLKNIDNLSLLNRFWYLNVNLYKNWNLKWFRVHRLVAESFISNIKYKKEVNHIDWNKQNNKIENLEWCTRSENEYHSYIVLNNKWPFFWKLWKMHHASKIINQYSVEWVFIKEWFWSREIYRNLWLWYSSSIGEVCNGKRKTAYWFIWKYK
jgi:hypothetical protein